MSHSEKAEIFNKNEAKVNWHDKALWFVREKRDTAAHKVKGWEYLRELASGIKANTHLFSPTLCAYYPQVR